MLNTRIARARLAAVVLAPAFVLLTPAFAGAATSDNPSNPSGPAAPAGQDYRTTQTTTDRDGTHTTTTRSGTGADGRATYERSAETANANGRTTQTTDTGSMNPADASQGSGQDYRSVQTTTDRNGTRTVTTRSGMGSDGKPAFERTTETDNANGRTVQTTSTGSMSADNQGVAQSPAPAAGNNMSGNNMLGNPAASAIGTGSTPLVVVNAPGVRGAGM